MSVSEVLLRVVCAYLVLLLLTRLMGRKELRQLTFFNFVSGITIGSIAADLIASETFSLRNGLTALTAWAALTIVMGFIDIRSQKARQVLEGDPVILIQNGRILKEALQRVRLDMDALKALLRQKNAFSVSEVAFAVLETDGNLSVMKKENQQPAVKQDVHPAAPPKPDFLPTKVISDGVLHQPNLAKLELSEEWIKQQVHQAGFSSISEIFYAELQRDGSLYIDAAQTK
ncbi:DUF421 domain-containing protein [Salibacterium aidingense]|uniref:DUF421 domain-containing protein n=1 Tax=Salibacterium aidingense TaxID=384933 RepID=UPI003BC1F450